MSIVHAAVSTPKVSCDKALVPQITMDGPLSGVLTQFVQLSSFGQCRMGIVMNNSVISPLPDPHESGERGLASLGERVKIDRSYHELGKISLSWAINDGLRH
jgi:hypothetical protein